MDAYDDREAWYNGYSGDDEELEFDEDDEGEYYGDLMIDLCCTKSGDNFVDILCKFERWGELPGGIVDWLDCNCRLRTYEVDAMCLQFFYEDGGWDRINAREKERSLHVFGEVMFRQRLRRQEALKRQLRVGIGNLIPLVGHFWTRLPQPYRYLYEQRLVEKSVNIFMQLHALSMLFGLPQQARFRLSCVMLRGFWVQDDSYKEGLKFGRELLMSIYGRYKNELRWRKLAAVVVRQQNARFVRMIVFVQKWRRGGEDRVSVAGRFYFCPLFLPRRLPVESMVWGLSGSIGSARRRLSNWVSVVVVGGGGQQSGGLCEEACQLKRMR